ncbi:hypothetical protein chiPu_0010417 [Chiloscyllium punctatum]|uniref:Uncharacterized protein n=1 Tax=Chiloscyllium punctatum TaxID=137246 RepID=A0A401SNJ3_CHIPU|nr:hypothetical protein [Chiloscyllium punctatum]
MGFDRSVNVLQSLGSLCTERLSFAALYKHLLGAEPDAKAPPCLSASPRCFEPIGWRCDKCKFFPPPPAGS